MNSEHERITRLLQLLFMNVIYTEPSKGANTPGFNFPDGPVCTMTHRGTSPVHGDFTIDFCEPNVLTISFTKNVAHEYMAAALTGYKIYSQGPDMKVWY